MRRFGWELFRLSRLAAGAVSGGLCGLVVSLLTGVPDGIAEWGVGTGSWTVMMAGVFAITVRTSSSSAITSAGARVKRPSAPGAPASTSTRTSS